jgi:RHS repeat-associated protein
LYSLGVTINYVGTQGGRLQSLTATVGQTTLQNLSYTYDNVGNITGITDGTNQNQKQCFNYDELDRLVVATTLAPRCGPVLGTGQYDEMYAYSSTTGNLENNGGMTLNYNAAGHAHAVSSTSTGESYSYDANGNMTSRTYQGVTYTLSYDAENRLVQITGGSLNAQYIYDGNGARVKALVGSEQTIYIRDYFESRYSPTTIPPVPLPIPPGEPPLNTEWRTYYQAGGARFAIRTQGGSHPTGGDLTTLLSDHLGSTVAAVDANNNVTRQLYDPWGEDRDVTSVLPTSRKFTGQVQAEVGLYFYNARWVDVYLNRWLQPDSIIPDPGNVLDWDRYSYVRNNPVNFSDPSGHMSSSDDDKQAGCNTPGSPQCIIDKHYNEDERDFELEYYFKYYTNYDPNKDPYLEGIDKFIVSSVKTRTGCAGGSTPDCVALVTVAALASPDLSTTDYYPTTSENTSFQKDVIGDPDCAGCGYVAPPLTPNDILMPGGSPVGSYNRDPQIRTVQTVNELQNTFNSLIVNATPINIPSYNGLMYQLPGGGTVGWRESSQYGPTIDVNIPGIPYRKIHLP